LIVIPADPHRVMAVAKEPIMKVQNLIEKLKQCDPEAVVRISVYDGCEYMVPVGELHKYNSMEGPVVDLGE